MPKNWLVIGASASVLLTGSLFPGSGRTTNEWVAWRDDRIRYILSPTNLEGETVVLRRQVALRSSETLRQMGEDVDHLADSAEMANFVAFVRAQSRMVDARSALGFSITDLEYFNASKWAVELPDLLRSQRFLLMLSSQRDYSSAVGLIHAQNAKLPADKRWIVVPFKARFIKSVDRSTYGRLLVFAPSIKGSDGRVYDKWITFGIETPDERSTEPPKSVSIVSIERSTSTAYFMDYGRLAEKSGSIKLMATPLLEPNPSKNCYDCHKTAVVPIKPEEQYDFDAVGRLVPTSSRKLEKLNELIGKYGKTRIAYLDTSAYGPSLGGRMPASGDRIADAKNCASCHDGFAPLSFPEGVRTDREVNSIKDKRGIAQTFVEEGWMPPGNDLSAQERKQLWRTLSKDYFDPTSISGDFVDWLKGR